MHALEIKPCGLGSRIRDMEAEWRPKVITDLISVNLWKAELALWNEPNVENVRQDIVFLASNSLHNLGGQK